MRYNEFIGHKIKNKYLVIDKLGEGGMGIVFKAALLPIEREVAIKIFLPLQDLFTRSQEYELRTRFITEGYIMAKMRHDNIMALNDFDVDCDICFLILNKTLEELSSHEVPDFILDKLKELTEILFIGQDKFIEAIDEAIGEDNRSKYDTLILKHSTKEIPFYTMEVMQDNLVNKIKNDKDKVSVQLSELDVRKIGIQICSAISYLHSHDVVHRDLKPANIFISGENIIKIADFGISEIQGIDLSMYGNNFLSADYCSPEQLNGDTVTNKSDLYSVGIILYELLTGRNPKAGYIPITKIDFELEPAWDTIFEKALAYKPKDRFESAAQFKDALMEIPGDEKYKKHGFNPGRRIFIWQG